VDKQLTVVGAMQPPTPEAMLLERTTLLVPCNAVDWLSAIMTPNDTEGWIDVHTSTAS
jgi:hypothetical protein